MNWPGLEIVIVDNGSRDGSAELLAEAGRAGVCALLGNDVNRQHGPGLNQGISWLASRPGPLPAWIWILDSDVIAARPGVLAAALAAADSDGAALVFAAGDRSHPLYDWATGHHDPHFGEVPGADQRYKALLRTFRKETGTLTGTSLSAACG